MECCRILWIPDITNWWQQQEEIFPNHTNLSNLGCNEFSIIPYDVGMEASCSLGRDIIGLRLVKTTGNFLCEKVVVRQFARAINGILTDDDSALDTINTENDMEMMREVEERTLHRVGMVNDLWEISQCSRNVRTKQNESRAQDQQMTPSRYISDTEDIDKACRSNIESDGVAAFKLSEKSPVPPALSAKNLLEGRTEVLIVCIISRIDHYPAESD